MKKVGYAFYVHKSNLNELFNIVSEEERNHIVYVISWTAGYKRGILCI